MAVQPDPVIAVVADMFDVLAKDMELLAAQFRDDAENLRHPDGDPLADNARHSLRVVEEPEEDRPLGLFCPHGVWRYNLCPDCAGATG